MSAAPDKRDFAARRRAVTRDQLRARLKASQYIRRLHEIAATASTIEPEAVPAMRLKADVYFRLLAKVLPDLKAMEHSGEINHRHATEIPDEELGNIATGSRDRAAETPGSPQEPGELH